MKKQIFTAITIFMIIASPCLCDTPPMSSDDLYVAQLNYKRSKIDIMAKKRYVNENYGYSSTDYYSTTYSVEASTRPKSSYSNTWGNSTTISDNKAQVREIDEWFIVRGGMRNLSDSDFLDIVGQHNEAQEVRGQENARNNWKTGGTILSIGGILYMIAVAQGSNASAQVTVGGLVTVIGFIISAFNSPATHYITPDYAQELADSYNLNLKKQLNLPVTYN